MKKLNNRTNRLVTICILLILVSLMLISCKKEVEKEPKVDSITFVQGPNDSDGDIVDEQSDEEVFFQKVSRIENEEYVWLIDGLAKYAEYKLDLSQGVLKTELIAYNEENHNAKTMLDKHYKDGGLVTASFILWIENEIETNIVDKLIESLETGRFTEDAWYDFTGRSTTVLWDMYCGRLENEEVAKEHHIYFAKAKNKEEINLTFAGDINFDENWSTMKFLDKQENGSFDVLSEELIEQMVSADLMMLNNEFTYSDRGAPMKSKAYTFRAKPERVNILGDWGVDLVCLANNHIFDYGEESFYDTLSTLDSADINYIGAGKNLEEAMQPIYYIINGKKIAFVSATRAEKYILTPEATEDGPGVLRTYDSTLFIESIREAEANSDIVVAYVHWGTEYSPYADQDQKTLGKEYIDAGADVVLGGHSHCLQGIEYYNGKPIVYSMSDFWFNDWTTDTTLVRVMISSDSAENSIKIEYLPCIQKGIKTSLVLDEKEKQRILKHIEEISYNISINENGLVEPID